MKYYTNFELTKYNSFCIKSFAKEIWFPENEKEITKLLKELKKSEFDIIGKGTNILLNDKGVGKIICLLKMPTDIKIYPNRISVHSGAYASKFIETLIKNDLTGLEFMIGIPGLIGGAIYGNAGSGGYNISDYIEHVYTIDRQGKKYLFYKEEMNFKRRYSIFQENQHIILGGTFKLKKGIDTKLLKYFKNNRKKIPRYPSAGGVFINWHQLKPFKKELIGLSVGDAVVSNSVNIIINKGQATGYDVIQLINKIKKIVKKPLNLEVKLLGV